MIAPVKVEVVKVDHLTKSQCRKVGLRYLIKKGGCYARCRNYQEKVYDQREGKCVWRPLDRA